MLFKIVVCSLYILLHSGWPKSDHTYDNVDIVNSNSPVENQNDLELDFKVFFFADSCCSDIVLDETN